MNKLNNKKEIIPIFFATDENYIPFLDVALSSLVANASKNYNYVINVLNTGLSESSTKLVKRLENENFTINFVDITESIEPIKSKLRNVYHFSLTAYYRLFIQSLFPQYKKALYLDCDIVVIGDISKLYKTQLGQNLLGAVTESIMETNPAFINYTKIALDIEPKNYFNSGILVMNLDQFRKNQIEDKFIYFLNEYNFDVIAPDQDYLNVLCKNKIKYLNNGWNKNTLPNPVEGELNIIHYALYKKPWQYDDTVNGEYFWKYARLSPFYNKILEIKNSFNEEKRLAKERASVEILSHANRVISSDKTFAKVLSKNKYNTLSSFFDSIEFNFGLENEICSQENGQHCRI